MNAMKNLLGIETIPPSLERLISAASKLKADLSTDLQMESIPLKELPSLVEKIHLKTQEASQQTSFDMWEFLHIDKALQGIQGELLNNTSKLTEKTGKARNTVTKSEGPSNTSSKNQANHWKSPR